MNLQTIDQVVPPLVEALKKQNKDVLSGSSELLLSFVAAFEHIPWHRRLSLFESLVNKLGAEDFLFALLGMLADKYAASSIVQDFAVEFTERFAPEIQLVVRGYSTADSVVLLTFRRQQASILILSLTL